MKFACEIDEHSIKITSACTIPDLCTCLTVIVNKLYREMPEELARGFKGALKEAFANDVPFEGPEELKKKQKEKETDIDGIMDSIKEVLRGLGGNDDKAE